MAKRRRVPRIVPTLVMSASCASVIPALTLLTQACGSDNACTTCYDVAEVSFNPDHFNGGDVAAAFDVWKGNDASDDGDALDADAAADASDGD
jgi:hypothetical protein